MTAAATPPADHEADSDPHLVEIIRAEIVARGPLPFARYMELALLHPAHGYYATRPAIGRGGDFVTSPELHPAFAACLMRQAAEVWRALDRPSPFTILEWGAGTGVLARDLLGAAQADEPAFAAALDYAIHEISPILIGAQQATLSAGGQSCRWTDTAAPDVGLVLANEVLDALPVHRLTQRDGQVLELFVDWRDGRFVEVAGPPSTSALATALEAGGVQLVDGQIAEISLAALNWLDRVATDLGRGLVVAIDYGDETGALYGPRRRRGTLLCYYRQTFNEEPFERIGRQDITAHVDFGALMRRAAHRDMAVLGLPTQGAFLVGLGLDTTLAELRQRLPAADYIHHRQAIADLMRPDRLGRFKVLLLGRDLPPDLALSGLSVRL